jgi:hypothetical protein
MKNVETYPSLGSSDSFLDTVQRHPGHCTGSQWTNTVQSWRKHRVGELCTGFIRGILRGVRYAKSLRVLFLHRRSPSWTTLVLYSRVVFISNEPTNGYVVCKWLFTDQLGEKVRETLLSPPSTIFYYSRLLNWYLKTTWTVYTQRLSSSSDICIASCSAGMLPDTVNLE